MSHLNTTRTATGAGEVPKHIWAGDVWKIVGWATMNVSPRMCVIDAPVILFGKSCGWQTVVFCCAPKKPGGSCMPHLHKSVPGLPFWVVHNSRQVTARPGAFWTAISLLLATLF